MDEEKKNKILNKLNKIKALAERGVGGEKETALKMYDELIKMYNISPEELEGVAYKLNTVAFNYNTKYERIILLQIIYKVTGSSDISSFVDKRRKKLLCECTKLEEIEIGMLFEFYKASLHDELLTFTQAFVQKNRLWPDETARCYKKENSMNDKKMTEEEMEKQRKILLMAESIDYKVPPKAAIEKQCL